MEVPLANKLLIKWNQLFYWLFCISYTLTMLIHHANGHPFGISEYTKIATVGLVGIALFLSYQVKWVYKNLFKLNYFVVYLILFNTTLFAYNNSESQMALIYYGASVFILTYVYFEKWSLILYEIIATLSAYLVYEKAYDTKGAIAGTLIQAILFAYVTFFFILKKTKEESDEQQISDLRKQRNILLDKNVKLVELTDTYRDIADLSPYSIAVLDVNGNYLYLNHIAVTNEQLRRWVIGKNDLEICEHVGANPLHANERIKAIKMAIETGNEILLKDDMIEDGIKLPFSNTKKYVPIANQQGEILRVMIYA